MSSLKNEMLIEILLFLIAITPYLFLIMFFKRFHYIIIINIMTDIENILDIIECIPNETTSNEPVEAFEESNNR